MAARLFMILAVIAAIVGGILYWSGRPRCQENICLAFPGKSSYAVKEIYEQTAKSYRALLQNKDALLRVEKYTGITKEQGQSFNGYKSMQILGLYETARSPYPGAISDQITCEDKFKPVFSNASTQTVSFTGLLNGRLQYGSCVEDQISYASAGLMMYCPKERAWYFMEFIWPNKSSPEKGLTDSVSCM